MYMLILVILVVHADARCGVSEGVVQCRDWREFERGNYPMANFVILERAMVEINVEQYPVLSRLVIRDPQTKCDAITANPWTTMQIGSLTCQVIILFINFFLYVMKKKIILNLKNLSEKYIVKNFNLIDVIKKN